MQIKRSEVDENLKWKITDLFQNDEEWEKSFAVAMQGISQFEPFRDHFLENAQNLYECLQKRDDLSTLISKVYTYANLRSDENSKNDQYQKLVDRCDGLLTKYETAVSFINPMILGFDEDQLQAYLKENESLQLYNHYFDNLLREKHHILTPEMEQFLAEAGENGQASQNIYSMLHDADMQFPTIKGENGEDIEITHGRFISLLESRDRRVRKDTFHAFYETYIKQKNTIASIYNASVKKDNFFAKARNYDSAIHASLSQDNIPLDVYRNLIATVHDHLPSLHRYVRLRKKRLGVSELHMYDLYTPIVKDANTKISFEDAKKTVLEGLTPMGEEYLSLLQKGFSERWIDIYENEGKRSGAYSWGTYGHHPFVLMNFDDSIDDMFTLAHEMGHALHSYYTSDTQKYIYSDYTIFLAEIASTVNEAVLMEYLLKTETDKTKKEYLLNYFMEQFRGTLFRQTMFAEFEMITHEMAEKGEPLTSDSLSKLYYDLNVKYYGPDMIVDDEIAYEWSRIPHFYRAYYVFQYATGYSAAISLSKKILEEEGALSSYVEMLKSGSKDYSINLLKKAGVDMSSPKPIADALSVFDDLVTQMENL